MFNKFSRLLTLSTTVLSLGLASTSATFAAKTALTSDQLLKFAQLSEYFKVSIGHNIKTAGRVADTYRGTVNGTAIDFSKTLGGDAGSGIGEVNLTALNGDAEQPPVVSMAVFNLNGSNTSNVKVTSVDTEKTFTLYDNTKVLAGATYSALVMKVSANATGVKGIDDTYVVIPLYHGKFTLDNLQQPADLSTSMKTKCFTNMVALEEFAGFEGDNTALDKQGLLTSESILDLKEMSKFVANCQRVDIDVELNDANSPIAAKNEEAKFVKVGNANPAPIIKKITLKYVN